MVREEYSVSLKSIVEEQGLTVLHAAKDFDTARVATADINRPALQLAGFYDYFDPKRLQLIGRVESTYLQTLGDEARLSALERFMRFDISALILCHDTQPMPELMELAEKYDRNLLSTKEDTSTFMADLISMLRNAMAPRVTLHGVLVEIYGEGVLIMGDSGVGKSETALELIKRGHRLIADDAVEIRRVSAKSLVGSSPENIRHFMELRGVGIINARRLFGIGAVKMTEKINMIVQLEQWDAAKVYDRMGMNDEYTEVLGVQIPSLTIPVKPGRNLAIIIEVAAMNNRQKRMGYNAAQELLEKLGMVEPDGGNPTDWGDF